MQHDVQPSLSRSAANEIQYWQTHINAIGPERGGLGSADLQKKHLLEASLGYATGKITEEISAKRLWDLSFYFKIVRHFKNQQPSLIPTHTSPPVPLPIWGTPKSYPQGLVTKTDILWGNRDFFFPFAKNRSTRFKSPYGRCFLKAKPILPQLKQDKHSLDLHSLLQNSSFQTWEGIMTVQFIALFSPPFWWYFQKKKYHRTRWATFLRNTQS